MMPHMIAVWIFVGPLISFAEVLLLISGQKFCNDLGR